jgi:hypothetical protein
VAALLVNTVHVVGHQGRKVVLLHVVTAFWRRDPLPLGVFFPASPSYAHDGTLLPLELLVITFRS